ncbi:MULTISPECIES: hypothetical protein [Enterobacteriaceae]|jgi:phosphopantothenoylcysteine synthetase/decarboxylase|uniref:Uncharacterized protein n=1 Tax=Raoultella ornithinolytica TaxID=54291 RepID=A0A9Q9JBQ0_RAOOR|nr:MULTISPECIES: hypothetical protein [Enterobacteriaceae]HBW2223979.1 hypothetical protein [Klebsiella quasipneumoniae subsp. quasipneumoniae]HDV6336289.1 hypothetical protein [Klebsiella michiganensis]EIX9475045.1 hypothetical protein [Klebsiella pneumoniae]MBG2384891.1 hypothetical protein [Klebsiella pneumoniae]MBV0399271.1 hypothetical protein [Klebsiella pneumoniae]
MKNLLKTVRDSIAAAMNGRTIEQMETEQLKQNVKNAVDDYLIRHPDWQPSTKPAPAVAPVTNTKQKTAKIKKALGAGAGGFQAHEIDPEMLRLARDKCRQVVASDPERYSHIIESTPLKRIE